MVHVTTSSALPQAGTLVRTGPAAFSAAAFARAAGSPREPVTVVFDATNGRFGVLLSETAGDSPDHVDATVSAVLPALYPEWLGDRSFCEVHGVQIGRAHV